MRRAPVDVAGSGESGVGSATASKPAANLPILDVALYVYLPSSADRAKPACSIKWAVLARTDRFHLWARCDEPGKCSRAISTNSTLSVTAKTVTTRLKLSILHSSIEATAVGPLSFADSSHTALRLMSWCRKPSTRPGFLSLTRSTYFEEMKRHK